tara:strand:+ start:208 stop:771 length:564 start_codon:yes stop_codon:yes gene_type:complete
MKAVGIEIDRVRNHKKISEYDVLLLPGVGAFGAYCNRLRQYGFFKALQLFSTDETKRIIGICVGMQALVEFGNEGGLHQGLGLIPGTVDHLELIVSQCERVPHVGWNEVIFEQGPLQDFSGYYYFTHSYSVKLNVVKNVLAVTNHGVDFVSAIKSKNILGLQFHPEKSGTLGAKLLAHLIKFGNHYA